MHSKTISFVRKGCCMKFGSVTDAGSMEPLPVRRSSICKKGVMKSASTPSMSKPIIMKDPI